MARRRAGRDLHGIVLLDKPAGLSSSQALQRVRRLLHARKAGHTGSLDPFATGMLPICLGEASKTAGYMMEAGKSYLAVAHVGVATSTGDTEGTVVGEKPPADLSVGRIEAVLSGFVGEIQQVPPMYSALKHQGERLYRLARQGLEVERKSRRVIIHRLEFKSWIHPFLAFEVSCSKGTYIRTLAEDICARLGSCGHLRMLRRLAVEPFAPGGMVSMEAIENAAGQGQEETLVLPLDAGLLAWPELHLDEPAAKRFSHGNPVACASPAGMVRVFGPDNRILGLGEARPDGAVYPKRVFVFQTAPDLNSAT